MAGLIVPVDLVVLRLERQELMAVFLVVSEQLEFQIQIYLAAQVAVVQQLIILPDLLGVIRCAAGLAAVRVVEKETRHMGLAVRADERVRRRRSRRAPAAPAARPEIFCRRMPRR